jgi:hypothetical protein
MQLGEASADEAYRIRYFPLSLTGPAFTWFTSLPTHSICSWKDLEQKFHAHYFIGSNEKKLIDLTTLRQRNNETPMEFISANLDSSFREELIKLLKEYKDCFAWDYSEMPGLDRSIVEHRLPIKPGFRPYKQPPRKIYKDEVWADVKKEVERLIDANFIRPCRYAEWISNIVPV